jgi:hypothetical protein
MSTSHVYTFTKSFALAVDTSQKSIITQARIGFDEDTMRSLRILSEV